MRHNHYVLHLLALSALLSCSPDSYDDTEIWGKVNQLDQRVTTLEGQLTRMNSDISSLNVLVSAVKTNVYITDMTETSTGYTLTFSDGRVITIVNGGDVKAPHIGSNGNWWIGDEDTGVRAAGHDGADGRDGTDGKDGFTPYIGNNGNWWVNDTDTGIQAEGKDGRDGKDGTDGATPYIGVNGNWWIGDTDSGTSAVSGSSVNGRDGLTPYIGDNGNWWIGTNDTGVAAAGRNGTDGHDGADGYTPYIGENGNWWINGTDTNTPATGGSAAPGTSDIPLVSIELYEGNYYWVTVINGEKSYLTDGNGHMIPVVGGVRPIIRVDLTGNWVISYDGGITFVQILDNSGNPLQYRQCDCKTFFRSVEYVDGYLVMILYDGTVVRIRVEGSKSQDYEITGIPFEDQPNPDPGTPNTDIPSGAVFESGYIHNVPVIRISMPGIPHPDGGWVSLSGTDEDDQNTWVELDDDPHGIVIDDPDEQNTMKADIVFIVDNSGSMSEEADAVARDIISWANYLTSSGLDARFGCVGYSVDGKINGAIDMTTSSALSTYLNRASGTSRTVGFSGNNASTLQSKASSYKVTAECGAMAIRYADANFTYRQGTNRYYANFTDEPNQPNGNSGYSVEFFRSTANWPSGKGTVYTVYSGSTSYTWTTNYLEQPWLISTYTGGTSFTTNASFTGVNLKDLPVTGAMTNSHYIYFTDIRDKFDGGSHRIKITILTRDGRVRAQRIYSKIFGTL